MSCGGGALAETCGSWKTTEKMMDILIYALIKLRQSDTEHSPLARQAIKRLEKQEKQLNETRTLCRMIQGAEDLEEVRLLSRSMQKVLGHQN